MWSDTSVRESAALPQAPATTLTPAPTKAHKMTGFLQVEKLAKAFQADKPVFADRLPLVGRLVPGRGRAERSIRDDVERVAAQLEISPLLHRKP
eukprot:gene34008-56708_t